MPVPLDTADAIELAELLACSTAGSPQPSTPGAASSEVISRR